VPERLIHVNVVVDGDGDGDGSNFDCREVSAARHLLCALQELGDRGIGGPLSRSGECPPCCRSYLAQREGTVAVAAADNVHDNAHVRQRGLLRFTATKA
jgi:hypothetical protein